MVDAIKTNPQVPVETPKDLQPTLTQQMAQVCQSILSVQTPIGFIKRGSDLLTQVEQTKITSQKVGEVLSMTDTPFSITAYFLKALEIKDLFDGTKPSIHDPITIEKVIRSTGNILLALLTLINTVANVPFLKSKMGMVNTAVELLNSPFDLYQLGREIAQGEKSIPVSLLRACDVLSSASLTGIALATLIVGEAVQLSTLVLALTIIQLGSQATLYCIGA